MSATSVNSASPNPRVASAGRADAQARRDHRRARVVRHRVAVHRDVDLVQEVLGLLAVDLGVAQVDEHEVHVGAAGADGDAGILHVLLREPLGDDVRAARGRAPGAP